MERPHFPSAELRRYPLHGTVDPGIVVEERFRIEHRASVGGTAKNLGATDLAEGATIALRTLDGEVADNRAALSHAGAVRPVALGDLGTGASHLALERVERGRKSRGGASRLASVALGLMVLTSASTSWCRAYARLLHVRESGAERCPDTKELRSRVAERLGYDPFRQDASTSIRVGFRSGEAGFTADVEAFDSRSELLGRRRLASTDETCRDLADSVVLTVTLLLDTPPPGETAAPPRPHERQAAAESPREGAAPVPAPAPWTIETGLSLVASLGFAPSPSAGARLAFGVRRGPWALSLGGRLDLPSEGKYPAGTVETAVHLVELSGCGHFGRGFVCVVGAAGAITADGRDVSNARRTVGPFGAVGGRIGADLPLVGPLALRGSVDVLALVVRTAVLVGQDTLFTTPAAGGTFAIGVVGRFP